MSRYTRLKRDRQELNMDNHPPHGSLEGGKNCGVSWWRYNLKKLHMAISEPASHEKQAKYRVLHKNEPVYFYI